MLDVLTNDVGGCKPGHKLKRPKLLLQTFSWCRKQVVHFRIIIDHVTRIAKKTPMPNYLTGLEEGKRVNI